MGEEVISKPDMRHERQQSLAIVAFLSMASCAHEVAPVGPPTKASSEAAPQIFDAHAQSLTPTLRKSSEAFAVSAHPVPVRAWLSRFFKLAPPSSWARTESQLDLPTGLLSSPTLLDDLGIDANGISHQIHPQRHVDGRWLVAASPDKALLEKTSLAVKSGPRSALRATVDLDANLGKATGAGLGRWDVVVERSSDATSFELTCRTAP